MKNFFKSVFLFLFISVSCINQQDFNQLDDLSVIPNVATSIFYFESPENVINQSPVGIFYDTTFIVNLFDENFSANRLLDATITYQLENTTSKELMILIEFLDATDTVIDRESFTIQPQPIPIMEKQVHYGDGGKNLDILRNTTTIRVTSENLSDNISESIANEPKIILRSSGVYTIRLHEEY